MDNFFAAAISTQGQKFYFARHYLRIPTTTAQKNFFQALSMPRICSPELKGERCIISGSSTPGHSGATVIQIRTKDGLNVYFKRWCKNGDSVARKTMAAEVAAYELNKVLGLDLVPETRIMKLKGTGLGSAQTSVPKNYTQGTLIPNLMELVNAGEWTESLSELMVLDYIGSFGDRHAGNIFFYEGVDKKLMAIDHDIGFTNVLPRLPPESAYSGGRLPNMYTSRIQQALRQMTYQKIEKALKKILPTDMIESTWMRCCIAHSHMSSKVTVVTQ